MGRPTFTVAGAVLIVLGLSVWGFRGCRGRVFSFEMHHRFSDPVRRWSQSAGKLSVAWPEKGSYEYYAELVRHDQALRGWGLLEINSPLAFSDGNSTIRMNSLGFLHYTTVQLGNPGMKYLVALDTGSDLFWVPCNCSRCAPTESTSYASDFNLSIYNPDGSSTSKRVACSSSLCSHHSKCLGTSSSCPYSVSYISAETSTSGVLVEDVLHLKTEGSHQESVEAYIMLGPTYNISVTQFCVGKALIDVYISALFDSGTSFTYLVDPFYSRLVKNFNSQVQDRRHPSDPRIPFEYCYDMSPDTNLSLIPSLSLTMKGGSLFAVHDPLLVISTQTTLVYCLAVVKSAEMNIIGQNFMTGYRIVFDREKLVLGWKSFDCYDMEDLSNSLSTRPHNPAVPTAIAAGLNERSSHKKSARDEKENDSQSSSFASRLTSHGSFTTYLPILLHILCRHIHPSVYG